MNKRKLLTVAKYQFKYTMFWCFVSAVLVLALNLAIGLILNATAGEQGGSNDIIAIVFVLLLGAIAHNESFRYSLYNGTSRKTFFLSTLITLSIFSVALSLLTTIFMQIAISTNCSVVIYNLFYPQGYFAMLLWITTLCLFLAALSWFVKVLYEVLSYRGRIILMLGFTLAILVLSLLEVLLTAVSPILVFIFGLNSSVPSPVLASLFFVILYTIFIAGTWLLIRKQEVK